MAGGSAARLEPAADELRAGVFLGGYGTYASRRADGVMDAPEARAMYVGSGNRAVLVLALDLVGLDAASIRTMRRRMAEATGLPGDAVLVACTHSRSSPDTQGLWGGVPASYHCRLVDVAVETARSAYVRARPVAALRVGTARVTGLTRNRRGWPEVDNDLVALQAVDARGDAVATLVNFACHPTTLPATNRAISRDFPGVLVDRLDAELGGVTVFVNGAQGDVNPAKAGDAEAMRALGDDLAHAVLTALTDAEPIEGAISVAARRPLLPVAPDRLPPWGRRLLGPATPPLRMLAASGALTKLARALASRKRPDLAQVLSGFAATLPGALVTSRGAAVQTTVTAVAFGREAAAVSVPGEATTRLAAPVKGAMAARHRLILGLTHDTLGYLLPPDEWLAAPVSGYEESVSLGREAGPAWASAARDASLRLAVH